MSMTGILIAALVVGGTGLFIGVFLGVAGKKSEEFQNRPGLTQAYGTERGLFS